MSPKVPAWLVVLLSTALALSCRPQPQPGKTVAPTSTPQSAAQLNPPGFPPTVLGKPYPGRGVVTIVNRQEGWVEIEHERLRN